MALSSTISSKGQITIPLEIRQRLGLKTGDRVAFVVEQGRTIIRPARRNENSFEKYAGVLPVFVTADEINAWVRNLRDDANESK